MAEPSRHERHSDGGRYSWKHTGPVPVLPDVVAELLPDGGGDAQSAVSDAEVAAWLDGLAAGGTDDGSQVIDSYLARVAAGGSRHDALKTALRHLVLLWHDRVLVGRADWTELLEAHRGALATPPAGQKPAGQRRGEAESLLAWCLAQPAHDLDFGPAVDMGGAELAAAPSATAGRGEDAFWSQRAELEHVQRFARSRLVSPWAVLGVALVQALLLLPPEVVLPPIIGGPQPAQLFCAIAANSGAGKSAALGAARDLLAGDSAEVCPVRSGEGISALFRRWNAKAKAFEWVRRAALVTFDEIDTMAGQAGRKGDTSMSTLRSAWSGSVLGGTASDPTKVTVPAMSYRLGVVVGVQSGHAGELVADLAGTAQRFLWMPGTDPTLVRWEGDRPVPLVLGLPALPPPVVFGHREVPVCATARAAIEQGQLDRNRGVVDALDGHALQNQERVALALAVLGGRIEVGEADWQLAGVVMARSDATRAQVLAAEPRRPSRAQEAVDIDSALDAARALSAVNQLAKLVARHHRDTVHRGRKGETWQPGCTTGCLRPHLSAPARAYVDAALAELVDRGLLRLTDGRWHPA